MGSGKTFWGYYLSTKLQYHFIDLDTAIEKKTALTTPQIFAQKGEHYFRKIESNVLEETIKNAHNPTIIATGGGTPCFYNGMAAMNNVGKTIWLNQSISKIIEQITVQKTNRPLIENIPTTELAIYLEQQLKQRVFYYSQSHFCLTENNITQQNLLQIILQNE